MKAPASPSDITKEWIEYILTDYESRENPGTTVTADTFETSAGCQLGEGIVGEIIRVHIKARLPNLSKEYNLVIKFKGQHPRIDFIYQNAQIYLKELLMYSKVLLEFNNFQKNLTNNQYPISHPKFIYGKCTTDEFVLVMENIKDMGFIIHNKEETFNFEHLKMAVIQLVRLHAVSYSYDHTHTFLKKYPEFEKTEYGTVLLRLAGPAILDVTCEVLKKEKNHDLLEKINSKKKDLIKQHDEMHNEKSYKLLCLVHGDAHVRNMMFKYNDSDVNHNNPSDIKLLDWQTPHWNTPVMDLHHLIYSTTSRELRKEHLEDILQFYHSTFVEATSNMGVVGLNWTYEDFKNDFNRMALYGFEKGIVLAFNHHCPELVQQHEDGRQKAINQSKFMKILNPFVLK